MSFYFSVKNNTYFKAGLKIFGFSISIEMIMGSFFGEVCKTIHLSLHMQFSTKSTLLKINLPTN